MSPLYLGPNSMYVSPAYLISNTMMTRLWDGGKVTAHTRYRWGQVGGWCGPLSHTEGREQPPGQQRQGTSRWGMYVSWLSRYRGLISTFCTVRSSCREYAHGNEAVCEGGKSGFSRFSPCHTLLYVCMRRLWPKILLRCVCEREKRNGWAGDRRYN